MAELNLPPLALFLIAPIVGSFIGLLAVRLPEARPVVLGRSRCDDCRHVLSIGDLVPLLSAACLGFRCRYCNGNIDKVHFVAEAGAIAIVASAAFVSTGWILAFS